MSESEKPIVLITGAAGSIGSALVRALESDYRVVGLDMEGKKADFPLIAFDLTKEDSVREAMARFGKDYGRDIAAVVHLAAYFDFTGERNPLYEKVNVEGTRNLMKALRGFTVERFIYSGTMLVHQAGEPGETIDEETPLDPKWAYPISKAKTEDVIRDADSEMPYLLFHLAGLYDDKSAVPTLTHQIARIYERDMKAHLYAGDIDAGQSFIHRDDMMRLFRLAIDRRNDLPRECIILAGEEEAVPYHELQDEIGRLIHGEKEWATISLPKPLAKAGAWMEGKAEPIIPDDFDQGEKPFIRPFMIDMADDHYALDISRAKRLLGWTPRHSIRETLPKIVATLKRDPVEWYEKNKLAVPDWMETADERERNPEILRRRHEKLFKDEHYHSLWAHFANAALGSWLIVSPATMGYWGSWMGWSDLVSGAVLLILGLLSLSWKLSMVRWGAALIGFWILFAPLVFWTPSAAAYLNGTLVGTLAIAFAACVRPEPGVSPVAALTGPDIPPGWDYNPSGWLQRMPIILLAFVGLYFSRYLAAYQLGHIEAAWDPFFSGTVAGKNGTEDIITSSVSEAWPVPDAGLGAAVYILEILVGLVGSRLRWRTMPWVTVAFGIMIVPLGAVSIFFIVIQPIWIGTWCTLCLIGAAAMVVQIPYSLDELVATLEFLWRRKRNGAPLLKIFFSGDTDEGEPAGGRPVEAKDEFAQSPGTILREIVGGGVGLPWTLAVSIAIGIWLMFTRLTMGAEAGMANADHVIGSLVVTVSVIALAEVGRPARFANIVLGAALLVTPFVFGAGTAQTVASIICGIALIGLAIPRGPIRNRWGQYGRFIV